MGPIEIFEYRFVVPGFTGFTDGRRWQPFAQYVAERAGLGEDPLTWPPWVPVGGSADDELAQHFEETIVKLGAVVDEHRRLGLHGDNYDASVCTCQRWRSVLPVVEDGPEMWRCEWRVAWNIMAARRDGRTLLIRHEVF